MKKYTVTVDGGSGGSTEIEATDIASAMSQACAWVLEGDWGDGGCECCVTVVDDDDPEQEASEIVEIPSTIPEDVAATTPDEVIYEDEGEYSTGQLVRVDGTLYLGIQNGGSRGAYDRTCGDGVWRDYPCESFHEISREQATAWLLSQGMAPKMIAEKLSD